MRIKGVTRSITFKIFFHMKSPPHQKTLKSNNLVVIIQA